jgi:hypothetical protein
MTQNQQFQVQISEGVKIRAQIDTETVRALLLINGGAVFALISLLPSILSNDVLLPFASQILIGIIIFVAGLFFAVLHNQLRRECSLHFESYWQREEQPPNGHLLGMALSRPRICWFSIKCMWLSIIAFTFGGLYVAVSGWIVLKSN